jgi:hypothetical protein
MKQSVLKLKNFFLNPSKKTVKRHKRIVGVSAVTASKNREKKMKALEKEREVIRLKHDQEIDRWEKFFSSCKSIDQRSRNPAACLQAFGSAPSPEKTIIFNADLTEEGSECSNFTDRGCNFSP